MAKYHPHPLGQVSGKIGGLIVRRQRNGTNVLARVGEPSTRTHSDGQLAQQLRLTGAMAYAKGVLTDPWHRRAYEVIARERNRRVDKLVVRDYLLPPVVEDLDVSAYMGQPGAALRAYAVDDIQVVTVVFAIRTAAGETPPNSSGVMTRIANHASRL